MSQRFQQLTFNTQVTEEFIPPYSTNTTNSTRFLHRKPLRTFCPLLLVKFDWKITASINSALVVSMHFLKIELSYPVLSFGERQSLSIARPARSDAAFGSI